MSLLSLFFVLWSIIYFMETRIKATDYQMTPEVSACLDERLRTIEKFVESDEAARCEVELGRNAGHSRKSDDQWFAELNVIMRGGRFRATEHAATVNEALDAAKDEIVRQIRQHQQLHRRLLRKGGSMIKRALRLG